MASARHYLLHCRPRLEFHLGQIRALGHLYQLLVSGHRVTVLVIPYNEHSAKNATFEARLREDIDLTKAFYRNYLGFPSPLLQVVSTDDIELAEDDIARAHVAFQALYPDVDTVRKLVDVHGRTWASPQATFVGKCVASIKRFSPTHTICGQKHALIAAAFQSLLERLGATIEIALIPDLFDLNMASAMDNKDTAHTIVEVTDNDDIILHKLRLQHDRADGRLEEWLIHFATNILADAPARLTQGVQLHPRTVTERELALTRFLANVRRLVPYVQQSSSQHMDILFNGAYRSKKTQREMARYSELIRRLYAAETTRRVEVSQEYTDGASPTTVFEIRERSTEGGDHVANTSVIKFGDPYDLNKERLAFEAIVRASRTAGFADVKGYAGPYEGLAALRYQSADHFMGATAGAVIPLHGRFRPCRDRHSIEARLAEVFCFLGEHVHPTLWSRATRRERSRLSWHYNIFLPARYSLFVDSRNRHTGEFRRLPTGGAQSLLAMRLQVTEYHSDLKRVRAYTTDTGEKVDLFYDTLGEGDTQAFREGNEIFVEAEVRKQRRDTFDKAVAEDPLLVPHLQRQGHPEDIAERLLDTEFEEIYVGPVHGDLHSGNIITKGRGCCVIDYGKTSADGLVAHDIAMLLTDLHLRYVAEAPSLPVERKGPIGRLLRLIPQRRRQDTRGVIDCVRYEALPQGIKRLVSEPVFWTALTLTFLGSLKFSLSPHQRRHALFAAYHCFQRVGGA